METPHTEPGRITERIMAVVHENAPYIATSNYNRIYSAVLTELETALWKPDSKVSDAGFEKWEGTLQPGERGRT